MTSFLVRIKQFVLDRRFFVLVILLGVAGITLLWWCDRQIRSSTATQVFDTVGTVPFNEVGLVLGTSEKGRGGGPNQFFVRRMEAAAALYHAGKVKHLLLSG